MRRPHVALALGLASAAVVVPGASPTPRAEAAVRATLDPAAVAGALRTPSARISSIELEQGEFDFEGIVTSAGFGDTALAGFPTEGATYAVLTTGSASVADESSQPDDPTTRADDVGFDWQGGPGDTTRLRLSLDVAANATCVRFDYKLLTEEAGEAAIQRDALTVRLHEDPDGPETSGRPVASRAAGDGSLSPTHTAGTPYDAATPTIQAAAAIPSPRFGLSFTIADAGDGIADSAVFLDNLRAGRPVGGTCTTGVELDAHELVLEPRSVTTAAGQEQSVTARLLDHGAGGSPSAGQQVVLVRDGANPGTATVVTDATGSATHRWVGEATGRDRVTACWDADRSGTCDTGELAQTRPARVSWVDGRRPRIAFTDDTDRVGAVRVTRDGLDRISAQFAPSPWAPATEHTGELSAEDGDLTGVSTHEEETGEVYLRADGGSWVRVTCDAFRETHPVVSSQRNLVAYASDADGDWDVYVAHRVGSFDPVIGRVASRWMLRRGAAAPPAPPAPPAAPAAESSTCPGTSWRHVNVTQSSAGDDLWPAWGPGGRLVWSSTSDDPLGDLYARSVSAVGTWGPVTRLTDDPAADTQPAVGIVAERAFVAFTTTRFSTEGSVAAMPLGGGGATPLVPVASGPSSEAAWSGGGQVQHLAWTSRSVDPDGDVHAARVDLDDEDDPTVGTAHPVRRSSGVAETHAAWVRAIGEPDEPGTLAFTARSVRADVSDVHAETGDDRRVLAARGVPDPDGAQPVDEGGPAYSPDGERIVYSAQPTEGWPPGSDDLEGHELRVMAADGSSDVSLAAQTGRLPGDTDVDPSWSHDGSRIAWVRYAEGSFVPEVWIADLEAGTSWQVTQQPSGGTVADLSPAWSPDDRWLVVARAVEGAGEGPPLVGPRPEPPGTELTLLRADTSGDAIALRQPGVEGGSSALPGRTPAWSPDGTRIAYARGPQLEVVDLPGATPPPEVEAADTWMVPTPEVLVGFEDGGLGDATAARAVLEAADDPEWSPDGARLVVAGQPAGQPDLRGLYTIGLGEPGSGEDLPVAVLTDEPGPETDPAWQPREADVGVAVSVSGSPALVGTPLTATFTVTNNGPGHAPSVRLVTGYAPGATTASGAPPPGCAADGTSCLVPTLAPGATVVYTVSVLHPAPVTGAARGTVSTSAADPVPANDTAEAPYAVVQPPTEEPSADVGVTVVVTGSPARVGAPLQAAFTVTNAGPDTAESVVLTTGIPLGGSVGTTSPAPGCATDGSGCTLTSLAAGASASYVVDLSYPVPVLGDVTATAISATPDPQFGNNTASAAVEVVEAAVPPPSADLSVTVTLDGPTGWVGGRRTALVVVRNTGPDPAEDAELALSFPDVVEVGTTTPFGPSPDCERRRCRLGTLEPDARLSWTIELLTGAKGAGGVGAEVSSPTADPEPADNRDRERLDVLQPRVSVLPGVSRPGKAVLVFGEDMPPGTEVVLSWSKGIMTAPGPYVVEEDGTFTQPVFVLRRDRLGERRVRVTSASDEFTRVRAPLLVAYPLMVPVGDIVDRG